MFILVCKDKIISFKSAYLALKCQISNHVEDGYIMTSEDYDQSLKMENNGDFVLKNSIRICESNDELCFSCYNSQKFLSNQVFDTFQDRLNKYNLLMMGTSGNIYCLYKKIFKERNLKFKFFKKFYKKTMCLIICELYYQYEKFLDRNF